MNMNSVGRDQEMAIDAVEEVLTARDIEITEDVSPTKTTAIEMITSTVVGNTAHIDEVLKLKAEIRQLQQALRRMSTVDTNTAKSFNTKRPRIASIFENQSDSDMGLFDSADDLNGSETEQIKQLTARNEELQQENENLRTELESLKELCNMKSTGLATVPIAEIQELEHMVAEKLMADLDQGNRIPTILKKKEEENVALRKLLNERSDQLSSAKNEIMEIHAQMSHISTSETNHQLPIVDSISARSRSNIKEAILVDSIVNGSPAH